MIRISQPDFKISLKDYFKNANSKTTKLFFKDYGSQTFLEWLRNKYDTKIHLESNTRTIKKLRVAFST